MQQVDIEEYGQYVRAREAAMWTRAGGTWRAIQGEKGWYLQVDVPHEPARWVRPINREDWRCFRSLDAAVDWVQRHAVVNTGSGCVTPSITVVPRDQ